MYYGWRVVAVCFVAAMFTWGFGVYGASLYLSHVTACRGWPVGLVSGGVTAFYLANALSLALVGSAVDRFGARWVFISGSVALSLGIASIGVVGSLGHLYAAFVLLGLGYACLSLTGLTAALSPWFDRYQGRSIAIALMGASFGAMLVVPLLALAIERLGFATAMLGGAGLTASVMIPLSVIVLRYRTPRELGLAPDGTLIDAAAQRRPVIPQVAWTRRQAMATAAFWTATLAFALGLSVQVGFFTHQVTLARPVIGATGAAWLVSATGLANLLGRLLLARIADQVPVRRYAALIFGVQALVLGVIALAPVAPVLIVASLVYGFCLGQITTLSPIVVRREFGGAGFGAIYGMAATVIQLTSAFGPGTYGFLHDRFGGYGRVLIIAAVLEVVAMVAMLVSRPNSGGGSPRHG